MADCDYLELYKFRLSMSRHTGLSNQSFEKAKEQNYGCCNSTRDRRQCTGQKSPLLGYQSYQAWPNTDWYCGGCAQIT